MVRLFLYYSVFGSFLASENINIIVSLISGITMLDVNVTSPHQIMDNEWGLGGLIVTK